MRSVDLSDENAKLLQRLGTERDIAAAKFDGAMLALAEGARPVSCDIELRTLFVEDDDATLG